MIHYTLRYNTGNIINDMLEALNNYSESDIDILVDDIFNNQNVMFLYEYDYNQLLNSSDNEKNRIYAKSYCINIKNLPFFINEMLIRSPNYNSLLKKFKTTKTYAMLVAKDFLDKDFINLCISILQDDSLYTKFMNYEANKNIFHFNGSYNQEHYLLEMQKYMEGNKRMVSINNYLVDFDFTSDEFNEKYNKLKSSIAISQETKKDLDTEFYVKDGIAYTYHFQKFIDNDWEIDQSIIDFVFNNMNSHYTLEEKIAHIYIKLCLLFEYEGSAIKDESVINIYSKKVLENVTFDNPVIICGDFTHFFTKILNELDKDLDVRTIRFGVNSRDHEYIGLYNKKTKARIDFEPINIIGDFNDLTNAKLGLKLLGIDYIYDENNKFKEAIDKVYEKFISDKAINTSLLIDNYQNNYLNSNIPVDYTNNFYTFLENMKQNNIRGNELIMCFMRLEKVNYFGQINYSFVFYKHNDGYIERAIIIKQGNQYYYFRTSTQDLILVTVQELNNLFYNNILIYEDNDYTINGVGFNK